MDSRRNSPARVALVGDRNAGVAAHTAIPLALSLAAGTLGLEVDPVWIPTPDLERNPAARLAGFGAVWCVPGSPYASMEGALEAIRFARENRVPFLGTCGGFQHALIEYARNVLGSCQADHAESNPAAEMPLISPLACSLAEARGSIRFESGSKIATCYGQPTAVEEYNCRYGLNPRFRALLENSSLEISGVDEQGEARAVELKEHPFFIATLFQPERSALAGQPHPLINAYLRAASELRAGLSCGS